MAVGGRPTSGCRATYTLFRFLLHGRLPSQSNSKLTCNCCSLTQPVAFKRDRRDGLFAEAAQMAIMATAPEAREVSRLMFIFAAIASATTAHRAMMKAEYLRPISSYESQQTRDEIEILIPCDL